MFLQHTFMVYATLVDVLGGDELGHPRKGAPGSPSPQLPTFHTTNLQEGKIAHMAIDGPLLTSKLWFSRGKSVFFEQERSRRGS